MNRNHTFHLSTLCFAACCLFNAAWTDPVAAQEGWPTRFGPFGNGLVADADAAGVPETWDESTGENILWKIELPGSGLSTPVVLNGRLWLTSASEEGHRQYLDCIAAKTGEHLHHHLLFKNEDPEPLGNTTNTYASPSCVVTPDALYVHFGTYGTARLNPQTLETVWERRDIHCRHFRGPGSSPLLFGNQLVLTFDGIDVQFLTGLNAATGETLWRTERTTDYDDLDENGRPKRDGDLRKAYGTPAVATVNGSQQVISIGARAAFAYDAESGRELWTLRHPSFNAAAQPILYENLVLLATGATGGHLIGVELNETTTGDITETHVAWDRDKANSRMASPTLSDGRVYMVTHAGVGVCVDAATGKELGKQRLGGTFIASPLIANGLMYACSEDGAVVVCRADPSMEIVARNKLTEGMRSSPAVADGRLYLRTMKHLYCMGTRE